MANYGAADVKKLREDTDAPMMECKAALDEADGDFARAKEILREKGKAAAAKRADRATGAGQKPIVVGAVIAAATEGAGEEGDAVDEVHRAGGDRVPADHRHAPRAIKHRTDHIRGAASEDDGRAAV